MNTLEKEYGLSNKKEVEKKVSDDLKQLSKNVEDLKGTDAEEQR